MPRPFEENKFHPQNWAQQAQLGRLPTGNRSLECVRNALRCLDSYFDLDVGASSAVPNSSDNFTRVEHLEAPFCYPLQKAARAEVIPGMDDPQKWRPTPNGRAANARRAWHKAGPGAGRRPSQPMGCRFPGTPSPLLRLMRFVEARDTLLILVYRDTKGKPSF